MNTTINDRRIPTVSSECEEYTIRGQLVTEEDQEEELNEQELREKIAMLE